MVSGGGGEDGAGQGLGYGKKDLETGPQQLLVVFFNSVITIFFS